MNEAPKRRLKISLEMGADSLDEAARAFRSIAHDLEYEGDETVNRTAGGWADGYHLTVDLVDPEMTGDRFRAELETWRQERVAERGVVS